MSNPTESDTADVSESDIQALRGKPPETDEAFDAWCRLEVMGHVQLYGRVRTGSLVPGLLRCDILDSGGETYVKYFNPDSLFALQPIGEEAARELAERKHHDGRVMQRGEAMALWQRDMTAAKHALQDDGYKVLEATALQEFFDHVWSVLQMAQITPDEDREDLSEKQQLRQILDAVDEAGTDVERWLQEHARSFYQNRRWGQGADDQLF